MAQAFITSLSKASQENIFENSDISVLVRNAEKKIFLEEKYNIEAYFEEEKSLKFKNSKIIFLAIKPQDLENLEIPKDLDFSDKIIISILAGTKIEKISKKFKDAKIIRAMPNLGQFVDLGMTGIYFKNKNKFSHTEKEIILKIFNSGGKTLEVDEENKIDLVTAISGSGPAYFFYFTEMLSQMAENLGFSKEDSEILSRQTFLSSAKILSENKKDSAQDWRKKVSSKGGVTEVSIKTFQDSDFENIFAKAIQENIKKSKSL